MLEELGVAPWTILTIGWIALGVTALGVLIKFWPTITKFVTAVNSFSSLPEFMETQNKRSDEHSARLEGAIDDLNDRWERIRHQVENDHDTNLRDELTELLESVAKLAAWTERHEAFSDGYRDRIKSLEQQTKLLRQDLSTKEHP